MGAPSNGVSRSPTEPSASDVSVVSVPSTDPKIVPAPVPTLSDAATLPPNAAGGSKTDTPPGSSLPPPVPTTAAGPPEIFNHRPLSSLQLRPEGFVDFLVEKIGFMLARRIETTGSAKGFDRPILIFKKP